MSERILCPYHDDNEPSMVVYGEWAHCFVCKAHPKASELGLPNIEEIKARKKPDDIKSNLQYIDSLPTKKIRGFDLPYNDFGYYLVWPDRSYYKRRNWEGKSRYISPRGIQKPLFEYRYAANNLVIVEGEFNAASLQESVKGDFKIVSPGPASELVKYIKLYLPYRKIIIVVDRDAAGVVHGVDLKERLLRHNKHATLVPVVKDYNAIYEEEGQEALKKTFKEQTQMEVR